MNYLEWCELVLTTLGDESRKSASVRNNGIFEENYQQIIWGDKLDEVKTHIKSSDFQYILLDTFHDLERIHLVEIKWGPAFILTLDGQTASNNLFSFWEAVCMHELPELWEKILKLLNKLSNKSEEYFGYVQDIDLGELHQELSSEHSEMTEEDLQKILWKLKEYGFAFLPKSDYIEDLRATYRGLVWEHRRDQVIGVREIDNLVSEWETTSVDFKRELYLDTASQKAEFIKDVIGLANTQASGRRWLIIGFDDKTRSYYVPGEQSEKGEWFKKINQDRVEQILSSYTTPNIEICYELLDYKGGKVGRLEVLRDSKKLPYRVSKSIGDKTDKRRIEENQIFVRHGSHTIQPDEEELNSLIEEATRAKSQI